MTPAPLVQRPSTSAFQAGDHGFESRTGYQREMWYDNITALLPPMASVTTSDSGELRDYSRSSRMMTAINLMMAIANFTDPEFGL